MLARLSTLMKMIRCSLYLEGRLRLQQVRLHHFNSILKLLRIAI